MRGLTVLAASAVVMGLAVPASAQQSPILPEGLGLEHGALLFHGNYCGPGSRAPLPPIDALDAACMRHDACAPDAMSGRLPTCGCNARLRRDALRVAHDPRQPDDLRLTAQSVADGATLLPCNR